ncbi:hypothetical protein J4E83_005739 [Alternaria metachromatica]|uniref:uncharacterized protein n=1 Tax=Alternaria metachromatica TaxID=283354 RepID=UPI0020C4C00F|nr:uncharacterized protein J4E83_005739 [Alternaria metachromatica]KAI4619882.1 hypothetical protein J4E83_005739 [Alternaria metachromatica]KAI4711212.1 hypothetical protein J4E89_003777 [Alternaria sp. Ai002NY15]
MSTLLEPRYLPKRLIALEKHVVSPSLEAEVIAGGVVQRNLPGTLDKLKDVGAVRIAAMDAGYLSMHVLAQQSALGLEDPEGCRGANDAVHSVIVSRPTRFAGFAVLPMSLPEEAEAELNRSVTTLGSTGAMVWNHLKDGMYYDAARFHPVFATTQELDVTLCVHPATPTADIASKLFAGNFSAAVTGKLGITSWGWHVDADSFVLRLYSAGLFDRFAKLVLIIRHNGERLPMFIDRIDLTGLRTDATFDRVWKTNTWSTTSAFFTVRQFYQLRQVSPVERIMYSVDYPFGTNTDGWAFVEKLAEAQVPSDAEMDIVAWRNAEKLLGL